MEQLILQKDRISCVSYLAVHKTHTRILTRSYIFWNQVSSDSKRDPHIFWINASFSKQTRKQSKILEKSVRTVTNKISVNELQLTHLLYYGLTIFYYTNKDLKKVSNLLCYRNTQNLCNLNNQEKSVSKKTWG